MNTIKIKVYTKAQSGRYYTNSRSVKHSLPKILHKDCQTHYKFKWSLDAV